MTALLSRAGRLSSGALRRRINTTRAKSTTTTTATATAARAVPASIPLDAHTGGATVVSGDGATHVTTLGNGLRVVSERSPGHFAALGVYVDAGSRYEGAATAGFGHLLDRLAFRSSARFSSAEAMATIERLGGSIMSSSSRECIMYQAAVFPHDVGTALGLLADTTLRPRFLDEDVAELQAAVPWELQDFASKPELFLPEKMHEVAFAGTLGNPLLCPLPQLQAATPAALAAYHARWYRPERMVVAAVGVDHGELVRMCSDAGFGDGKGEAVAGADGNGSGNGDAGAQAVAGGSWLGRMLGPGKTLGPAGHTATTGPSPAYTGGTWLDPQRDVDFTQVHLGFRSAGIDDEHALYAYATLQMLLGGGGSFSAGGPGKGMYSRLYTRVLNQHAWIESCVAFHHCYTDTGLFGVSASCRPRNEHALLDVVAAEIEAVASPSAAGRASPRRSYAPHGGPTDAEVRRAKNQLKSNLLMNLESRMVQLEDLGRQIQVSGRKIPAAAMVDHIEAITLADITAAAARLLESPATLLVQGNTDGVSSFYPQVAASHGITARR